MEFSAADNIRYAIEEEGWTEIYEDRDLWVFKKMGARPESQDKIKLAVEEDCLVLAFEDGYGDRMIMLDPNQPDMNAVKDFLYEFEF